MKFIWKFVNLVGLIVLALILSAGAGIAQNAYEGKFSLPFQARWGNAVLPAGDYTFTMPSISRAPFFIYIRGESKTAIIMAAAADPGVASDHSQLTAVTTGAGYAVRSLEAHEVGLTFSYGITKTKAKQEVRNRGPVQQVAVSAAGH